MLRPTATLLLLAATSSVGFADDPLAPSLGAQPYNSPVMTVPGTSAVEVPAAPLAQPFSPEPHAIHGAPGTWAVPHSAGLPVTSAPSHWGGAPATGCGCQGGGSLAQPGFAGTYPHNTGYEALGWSGCDFGYTGAQAAGGHIRHPFYSYRSPWYANGPMSRNITIAW